MFSARNVLRRTGVPSFRTYATQQTVKPPVALFGVDGTYATALYTAAKKTSQLDAVAKTFTALGQLLQKDAKLGPVIASPTLNAADKQAVVHELLKNLPKDGGKEVKNFLEVLAENNRLGVLPSVVEKFDQLVRADKGEVEIVVTSAVPLDQKLLQRIDAAVGSSGVLAAGKKGKIINKVQSDIKGGLIVEVGDRTIDLSISNKIAKLNKLLSDSL